ncbi:MAG: hypothetical protein A3G20_06125 [Acidobacteria bacterium RIFCSPLOWO2_12_FULL_59_11]|nr:MAG: hypothetical protein A3G20_06125 [Acidobacteria bacterium RIFCSPLOWO2_12_FULL_59_11]
MGVKVIVLSCWIASLFAVAGLSAADGDLRLVDAAKNKDKEAVLSLLKQKVDVNAAQGDGATALVWAAHWNDLETADLLIRAGANANAATDNGITPLWEACASASAAMVEKLLKAEAKPDAALETGATPLMMCARTGGVEAVRSLVAAGANVNAMEAGKGQTALMWAVANRHPETVKALIERGADVGARTKHVVLPAARSDNYSSGDGNYEGDFREVSKGGFTPLLFAAQHGDLESAKLLLAAGADVNEATPEGSSALIRATANNHPDVAEFLLGHGANPNAADENGMTALHYTVLRGLLLLRGHSRKPFNDYLYRPTLPQLVKALLAHGADPNARLVKGPEIPGYVHGLSPVGTTALLLAAATNDADIMRLLVAAGADPNLAQENGVTPLMMAVGLAVSEEYEEDASRPRMQAVQAAVEAGADVNATNDLKVTALHAAAAAGANDMIQFLVEKGANVNARDQYGQTAWTLAANVKPPGLQGRASALPRGNRLRESTVELLVKLGATPVTFPEAERKEPGK